ncbi:MAG: HEAT repeat domain-containing protein [Streptomyces sp.]|uniref:HEAT repeat domain-containing protein n=1 Tax=Streptomyces sp. TaxID=1931 RepID=UPI003D6BEE00
MSAFADPSRQVRAGAATALSAADPAHAVPAVAKMLGDPNADARKAAVLALLARSTREDARGPLATAVLDPDADVRVYAARAAAPPGLNGEQQPRQLRQRGTIALAGEPTPPTTVSGANLSPRDGFVSPIAHCATCNCS